MKRGKTSQCPLAKGDSIHLPSRRDNLYRMALAFMLAIVLVYVWVVNAWICEDAHISFRTIYNFFAGYGLRWNAGERVQSYTHPLWLFLHFPLFLLFGNIHLACISLCGVCVAAMVFISLKWIVPRQTANALLFVIGLVASRAFVDYSSAGLETPLSFLLMTLFYLQVVRISGNDSRSIDRRFYVLCIVVGLLFMTRQDLILMVFPVFLFTLVKMRKSIRFKTALATGLCFLPPVAWELFSLLYYGSLFPNTAYAKLGTQIPREVIMRQGIADEKGYQYRGSSLLKSSWKHPRYRIDSRFSPFPAELQSTGTQVKVKRSIGASAFNRGPWYKVSVSMMT